MSTAVKVTTFAVGSTRHLGSLVGLPHVRFVEFPALVALIRHPSAGYILFDTGYGRAVTDGRDVALRLYRQLLPVRLAPSERIDRQLAARGIATHDLALVFLSHAHPDHLGGLGDLPPRPVFWSRAASGAFTRGLAMSRFREATFAALRPAETGGDFAFIEDRPALDVAALLPGFDAGFDVLGDGSLVAVPLPGHARGQYGLLCRLVSGRYAFLVADAAWITDNITKAIDPSSLLNHLAQDAPAYRNTLARLRRVHRERDDVVFLPSHCADAIDVELG